MLNSILLIHDGITKTPLSNEAIAKKLLIEPALQQIYFHADKSSRLIIQNQGENSDLSMWMEQNVIDSCFANNYSVYSKLSDSMDSTIIVEITQPSITFAYHSIGNKWLFFNKGYKRLITSNFHISITEKNGKLLFSQNFSDNFADTLSNIAEIENERLIFTKGEKIKSSIGKQLIEPVLITASTVTVVYLFYSLRSGK